MSFKNRFVRDKNRAIVKSDGAMQVPDLVAGKTKSLAFFKTKDKHLLRLSLDDDFNVRIPIQNVAGGQAGAGRQRKPNLSSGFRSKPLTAFLASLPIESDYIALGRG